MALRRSSLKTKLDMFIEIFQEGKKSNVLRYGRFGDNDTVRHCSPEQSELSFSIACLIGQQLCGSGNAKLELAISTSH